MGFKTLTKRRVFKLPKLLKGKLRASCLWKSQDIEGASHGPNELNVNGALPQVESIHDALRGLKNGSGALTLEGAWQQYRAWKGSLSNHTGNHANGNRDQVANALGCFRRQIISCVRSSILNCFKLARENRAELQSAAAALTMIHEDEELEQQQQSPDSLAITRGTMEGTMKLLQEEFQGHISDQLASGLGLGLYQGAIGRVPEAYVLKAAQHSLSVLAFVEREVDPAFSMMPGTVKGMYQKGVGDIVLPCVVGLHGGRAMEDVTDEDILSAIQLLRDFKDMEQSCHLHCSHQHHSCKVSEGIQRLLKEYSERAIKQFWEQMERKRDGKVNPLSPWGGSGWKASSILALDLVQGEMLTVRKHLSAQDCVPVQCAMMQQLWIVQKEDLGALACAEPSEDDTKGLWELVDNADGLPSLCEVALGMSADDNAWGTEDEMEYQLLKERLLGGYGMLRGAAIEAISEATKLDV